MVSVGLIVGLMISGLLMVDTVGRTINLREAVDSVGMTSEAVSEMEEGGCGRNPLLGSMLMKVPGGN